MEYIITTNNFSNDSSPSTDAQHYSGLPLVQAQKIFHDAYQKVNGICWMI